MRVPKTTKRGRFNSQKILERNMKKLELSMGFICNTMHSIYPLDEESRTSFFYIISYE